MLLKSIKVNGLLSFRDVELELRPLNVLVGPNASGKSNLIEIMALLQAVPRDLAGFFRHSGGISDWMWKGTEPSRETGSSSAVEVLVETPTEPSSLRYVLGVEALNQHPCIFTEQLGDQLPGPSRFFHLIHGIGSLSANLWNGHRTTRQTQQIKWGDLIPGQSILSQRKDPGVYPEMDFLATHFNAIHLYREWNMGRSGAIRWPVRTDDRTDSLYENFSNLALILNRLNREGALSVINEQLKLFYETYEELGFDIHANTMQLWIREQGLSSVVPATRLSDGTLRFLALLTILCHPTPPPLICIEEPELGLHPDVIHQVAKLLMEASKRTQLIVTTHSAELIDHLWEDPESVVICERYPDTGTEFNRLKKDELESYLERYKLGELWLHGHIGGTRF